MKAMKNLLAVVFMAVLAVVLAVPAKAASPYTEVNPSVAGTMGLKETLEVTQPGGRNPQVTYTLTLGNITAYNGFGDTTKVTNAAGVNGKSLATVTFNAGEVSNGTPVTKNYNVDSDIITAINNLKFDRPGIYYWEITKTSSSNDSDLSNHNRASISNHGTALVVRVDDVNGTLTPTVSVNIFDDAAKTTLGNKNPEYKDNYAAVPGTLTLKKAVTGNQGEKDRYFKFTVTLSNMTGFDNVKLTPTGSNTVNTATAKYGENITGVNNLSEVTIANGTATFTFWLRDQEEVQIPNIPGIGETKYAIAEEVNTGYTVTYDIEYKDNVTDGDTGVTSTQTKSKEGEGASIGTRALSNDRVVFENDRASSTPTGIILQRAVPLVGILLAIVLGSVLVIGRRRRDEA